MINRKIVEMECAKENISVSDADVEWRLHQDIKLISPNLTVAEFTNSILRRWGKTLYEYKEDVIKPKLMMEKLIRSNIKVTEADLRDGYEARFGPKVECKMIVFDKGQGSIAQKTWEIARQGRTEFINEASKQFIPKLAQEAGKVPPIHKHFGDKELEDTAFRLKPGEVSRVLEMKDGTYVILLCETHIPANTAVRFEDIRPELQKEVFELRVAQAIPQAFAEMRKRANPKVVLDNAGTPSSSVLPPSGPRESLVSAKSNVVMPPAPKVGPVVTQQLPARPEVQKSVPGVPRIDAPMPTPLDTVVPEKTPEKKKT
jgi:hypothetical protein